MPLIRLHGNDNVLVAKRPLALGENLHQWQIKARAQVPAGHKIAALPIAKGARILKYNTEMGVATRDIAPG